MGSFIRNDKSRDAVIGFVSRYSIKKYYSILNAKKAHMNGCLAFYLYWIELYASGDFAATKAAGAYIHLAGSSIHHYMNALHIGRPYTPCFAVGMTDKVAGHSAFLANFTILTHTLLHLLKVRFKNQTRVFYHSHLTNASKIIEALLPKRCFQLCFQARRKLPQMKYGNLQRFLAKL